MTEIGLYMDEIKKKVGIPSDRQLAMRLGERQQYVNDVRRGRHIASDEYCKKLSDLSGDPVEKILIIARMSVTKENFKGPWKNLFKMVVNAALILSLFSIPSLSALSHTMYIMSSRALKFLRRKTFSVPVKYPSFFLALS